MAVGRGIAAFINGFMDGREYKDRKERQESLDAAAMEDRKARNRRAAAAEARAAQRFAWEQENRDQAQADRDYYRGVYRDAADAAEATDGVGVRPGGRTNPIPQDVRPIAPPERITVETLPPIGADGQPAPQQQTAATGAQQPPVSRGIAPRDNAFRVPSPQEDPKRIAADAMRVLNDRSQTQPQQQNPITNPQPSRVRGLSGPQPSTDSLSEAEQSVNSSRGASPTAAITGKQRERASRAFIDRYMEAGAPIVIKAMLARGDFDKAEAFQKWLKQSATRAGMKNWANAAFAAQVGDFDRFAKEIITAYNRLDYFGDDVTIVEEDSGFTKDREGNITGAKITFKDEKNGDTFEQVIEDPNDMVKMGITLLAPEQAFEYQYQSMIAGQKVQAEAAKAAAKAAGKGAKPFRDRLEATISEMAKNDLGFSRLPVEEQVKRAVERLRAIDAAAQQPQPPQTPTVPANRTAAPPVLRRQGQ